MGLLSGTTTPLSRIMKPPYVCTILLGVTILVYCFFALSIGVIDTKNLHLNPHPPWPTLQSPISGRRWRVLQSSAGPVVARPVKRVVAVEKALQGMGTLFRKGTRPMRELIVAHLAEETSVASLRVFLRTLHRSGATARADVVVLFPGAESASGDVLAVFHEEEASFQKMLALSDPKSQRRASGTSNATIAPFNWMGFKRAEEEQHVRGDVIWGSRRSNESSCGDNRTWAGYGSIAGFEMQDLDPQSVLSGFFDDPPAQLRRWVCYEMLLGMVRTKYRNVLVTQANVLFVGDPLAAIRRRQHLYLSAEDRSWLDLDAEEHLKGTTKGSLEPNSKESKQQRIVKRLKGAEQGGLIPSVYGAALWQSLDKAHRERVVVSSGFAMGGIEDVRKLANRMTTEVVRVALEKKTRRAFHDKAVLNYLVHQSSVLGKRVLDHVKIVANKDSVVHSLAGSKQPHVFWKRRGRTSRYAIVQSSASDQEKWRKIVAGIHSDLCQSPAESHVYQDCLPGHAPGLYSW